MDAPLQSDHDGQRARFVALRRKIFLEMGSESAKWRIAWMVPFNILVMGLLLVRGQPALSSAVQGAAILVSSTLFVAQIVRPSNRLNMFTLFVGAGCYFTVLSTTGGLASPLVVTGLPMILGASVGGLSEPKVKRAFFAFYLLGFLALAVLTRFGIGELVPPLVPVDGWSTAEYLSIAFSAVFFVAFAAYRVGCSISRAYERVALELVERREELCSENEDRTRELEGIAARLAHEVKNPLAAIKGLSTHMARNAVDPKTAERLSIVAAEADRLQSIVDGFLSFSRGFDDLKVAPTKPYDIARELALLLETRAGDGGVSLNVTGKRELTLNADGRKLRQALLNLILNAMQASPRGKPVTVDVAKSCASDRVTIRVIDEGPGMTPDVLERIRKPYFTTKEGGSGLGVAVARGLIEQHGGNLHFESGPGKGTTVSIELPYCSKRYCDMLPNPGRKAEHVPQEVPAEAPAR